MKETKNKTIGFRLKDSLFIRLDNFANEKKLSNSEAICNLLDEGLTKYELARD